MKNHDGQAFKWKKRIWFHSLSCSQKGQKYLFILWELAAIILRERRQEHQLNDKNGEAHFYHPGTLSASPTWGGRSSVTTAQVLLWGLINVQTARINNPLCPTCWEVHIPWINQHKKKIKLKMRLGKEHIRNWILARSLDSCFCCLSIDAEDGRLSGWEGFK